MLLQNMTQTSIQAFMQTNLVSYITEPPSLYFEHAQ